MNGWVKAEDGLSTNYLNFYLKVSVRVIMLGNQAWEDVLRAYFIEDVIEIGVGVVNNTKGRLVIVSYYEKLN